MSLKMYPYFLNFLKKLTRRKQNRISNHMSPLFLQIHFKKHPGKLALGHLPATPAASSLIHLLSLSNNRPAGRMSPEDAAAG